MARSVEDVYGLLLALVDNDEGFRDRGVREFLALGMLERAVLLAPNFLSMRAVKLVFCLLAPT